MLFDIQTGNISLTADGENALIVRKGKKIKIPSAEVEAKLIEEFQKTHDNSKLDKFREEYPELMDGDTLVCGKGTTISIYNSYNNGKEKPVDDWKSSASKRADMYPNSELQVNGLERWDKTDEKAKKRWHGELIKTIELKKGLIGVSYSHTEDILITPVALIKFIFDGGGLFDVYEDIIYSSTSPSTSTGAGGTEYTNRSTKKSFIAKSEIGEEIIVTRDAIYKKGMLKMDDVFLKPVELGLFLQGKVHKIVPLIDEKTMSEQYKNLPKTMDQALGAFEMFKQMSPDDLERMVKMGEAHGAKITPEMMKQFKEIPEAVKAMEKEGYLGKMKKGMAMGKGMLEGLGNEGIERLAKRQMEGIKKMKEAGEQPIQVSTAEGKSVDIELFFESPRKYKPLTEEFGAKKVA